MTGSGSDADFSRTRSFSEGERFHEDRSAAPLKLIITIKVLVCIFLLDRSVGRLSDLAESTFS